MVVKCDNQKCYWNKGSYCSKSIVVLNNGVCWELVDRNGRQRNPELWINPWFSDTDDNSNDEPQNSDTIEKEEDINESSSD